MKPTTTLYWTRTLLGVIVAILCAFLSTVGNLSLLNSITIALLFYIVTHYIFKRHFLTKIEKTSKILTTGVGAYFLTWIVIFSMFFTLMSPALTITSPAPNEAFSIGDTITIVAKITNQFNTPFSGANVTTYVNNTSSALTPPLTENSPGIYSATYNITSTDPKGAWKIKVSALINEKYREALITVQVQTSS